MKKMKKMKMIINLEIFKFFLISGILFIIIAYYNFYKISKSKEIVVITLIKHIEKRKKNDQ